MPLSYEQAKDQIAMKHNIASWRAFESRNADKQPLIASLYKEAAELYADSVARDAWDKPRISAGLYLTFHDKLNLSLADCDEMVDFIANNFYQPK